MTDDDRDWDAHDRAMLAFFRGNAMELAKSVTEATTKISRDHGINHAAQRELLSALHALKSEPSGTNFDREKWHMPSDLTPWSEARKELVRLSQNLASAKKVFLSHDQVVLHALVEAASRLPVREMGELGAALQELESVANEAASIEGRKGRRHHPDWMAEAAALCMSFWREQKGQEPAAYFNDVKSEKGTTEPANDFSRWFCDVMFFVGAVTPSQCVTLLR